MARTRIPLAAALTCLLVAGVLVPVTAGAAESRYRDYYSACTVAADDTAEMEWVNPTLEPADIVATPSLTEAGAIDVSWTIPEAADTPTRCFVIQWRATDKSETGFIGSIRIGRGLSEGDTQRHTLTGLTPGLEYKVKVAALSSVIGEWGWANLTDEGYPTPVPVYAAPSAPAITVSLDKRTASVWWTEPDDFGWADALAGYTVQMKQDTKPWTTICGSGSELIDLADQGSPCTRGNLTWGSDYQFRVSATSDILDGQGLASEWATSEVFTPSTTPEAPDEPDVEIDGKKLIVMWDRPDERGAPLQKYEVTWSVKGQRSGGSNDDIAPGKTTFTTPNLIAGNVYEITVRAKNRNGWSEPSPIVEIPIIDVPGPARDLAGRADDRSVALSWRPPSDKGEKTGSISGYRIEVSTDRGTSWDTVKEVGNVTSFTANKLTNGESYQFQVSALFRYEVTGKGGKKKAYELVGEPAMTKAITPFTSSTEPRNLSTRVGNRSITLSWEMPRDLGGTPLKKWIVEQTDNGGRTWVRVDAPGKAATSITLSGLVIGKGYQFRVTPVTEGDGTDLNGDSARTTEVKADGLPGKPFVLASSTTAKRISASWTRPAGGSVSATTLRVRLQGSAVWTTYSLGTATSWNQAGFTSSRTYEIQLQLSNSLGSGDWSSSATVRVR